MVHDLSHEKGTDFHLCYRTEMLGLHNGILAAVSDEYRVFLKSDRADGMELAGYKAVIELFSLINIAVAVILVYA